MLAKIAGKWHFRRGVPQALRSTMECREIWLSLQTTKETVARSRAGVLYSHVENLFQRARMTGEPTKQDLLKLLDAMSATYEENQAITAETHNIEKQILTVEGYLYRLEANKTLSNFLADATPSLKTLQDSISALSRDLADSNCDKLRDEAKTELLKEQLEALQDKLIALASNQNTVEHKVPTKKHSPAIFKEVYAKSTALKEGNVGLHTINHFNATYGIFCKLAGANCDIATPTREDAGNFIALLRRLPHTYGKASDDKHKSLEAIISASEKGNSHYRTLSEKTMRGHINTLTAIRKYAQSVGMMPKNVEHDIWSDHLITPLREITTKRRCFSPAELSKLQSHPWQARVHINTIRQILSVATYTGMRLEEICRLRPQDICEIDGVLCFNICAHKNVNGSIVWDPKTQSGERVIPVYPYILRKTGLIDRVKACVAGGHERVFHDLKLGKLETYGDVISKTFGRWKTSAGLPAEVTFHSFRHLFRTTLGHRADGKHYPVEWIDQLLGHESAGEGARYNAGTTPKNLQKLVNSVTFAGWEPMLIHK